jgi:hypothetical protein
VARLAFAIVCAPLAGALAAAGAGCSVLLGLSAPELLPEGGEGTFDSSSFVDTSFVDAPPQGSEAAPMDAATDTDEREADAAVEAQTRDVANEAHADVAADTGPVSTFDGGIPCGLAGQGCDPVLQPFCCESADDAGEPVFACVPSEQRCSGYFVQCATDTDCPNTQICCHYAMYIHCEQPTGAAGSCPGGGDQVCNPSNKGECPAMEACTLHLRNENLASPYTGCQ